MSIEMIRIDPHDDAALRAWWDLGAAADADRPVDAWPTWEMSCANYRTPRTDLTSTLVVAVDADRVVGAGRMSVFETDNPRLAEVDLVSPPPGAGRHTNWLPGRPVRMTYAGPDPPAAPKAATLLWMTGVSTASVRAPARRWPSRRSCGHGRATYARHACRPRAPGRRLAGSQGGVVSRSQVYALGLTRAEVRAHVRAGRWRRVASQTLAVHTGSLSTEGTCWAAVFEAGPRAFLDGASALVAAGLENFECRMIRVSVPRGARVRRGKGIDIRQTRRWAPTDLTPGGLPRSTVEIAAVRAALWAASDKQAALLLAMTVQQGLTTAERLGRAMLAVKRDRRRSLAHSVILDLLGGVRSLGELDLARECRRRGLPEPGRQVLRRGANGRYYLDVLWAEWDVVVEVDGIQHAWVTHIVGDALRHNDLACQGATVLRLPLLGLRVAPDEFFAQIERALVAAGWDPHVPDVAS